MNCKFKNVYNLIPRGYLTL